MAYKIILAPLLLLISVMLESSVAVFPLLFMVSILLFLIDDSKVLLFFIFVASLILDSLKIYTIGLSALSIFSMLLLFDLYKRNFEKQNTFILIFLTVILLLLFGNIAGYSFGLINLFMLIVYVVCLFSINYIFRISNKNI